MATNDGYSPYPLGLTAQQASDAIRRAYNLDVELAGLVRFSTGASAPLLADTKTGDFWLNSTTKKLFRGVVEDNVLTWFEV